MNNDRKIFDFVRSLDPDILMDAVESDDNRGFCIYCGEEAFGVEPDARKYDCECCGQPGVYGAEELLIYLV